RRLEREAEEVEDWFRGRERQRVAEVEVSRQKSAAAQAEQLRRVWLEKWIQLALEAVPSEAPRETRLDVHAQVQATLRSMDSTQAEGVTRRLVEGAMEKALAPWQRKEEIRRSLDASMGALPFAVRHDPAYAALRQRAWEAAVAAVGRISSLANRAEMVNAGTHALQPMIAEFEHIQDCQRAVACLYISGADWEEQTEAKESARRALASLPVGATQKQLEKVRDAAIAPLVARIEQRKEAARLEADQQRAHRAADWAVALNIGHIDTYLREEYEFDGGHTERIREAARLRKLIEPILIEELIEDPDLTVLEIRELIEDLVDEHL
ncbi:MAG: hypothetical protein ABIR70_17980, partial [Bryobacteraceae bacterium]